MMSSFYAFEHLRKQFGRGQRINESFALDHSSEIFPANEFHHQIGASGAEHSVIKYGNDIRMVQPCRSLCLALEAAQRLTVAEHAATQNLDGNPPVQS